MKSVKKILLLIVLASVAVYSVYLFQNNRKIYDSKLEVVNKNSGQNFSAGTNLSTSTEDWRKTLSILNSSPTTNIISQKPSANKIPAPSTETEKVAQNLFSQYTNLSSSADINNSNTQNLLAQNALQGVEIGLKPKFYSLSNLNISQADDQNSIKNYGNKLGEILVSDSPKGVGGEFTIFARAVQNNDSEEIKKLDPIIAGYKNILADALKLSVPKSAAAVHLNFVNGLSMVLTSIEEMKLVFDDPVRALTSVSAYETSVNVLGAAFKGEAQYLSQKQVSFQQEERGYILTNVR